ncbi:MAG: saccharopine dehydrogenase NADP-binding domain-containing protein [Leptospiraceae bacterium]|nr:saccharopine dehydrogenase NADP-binding domain-containing protein [Leptospiraceae bacterium]
MKKGVLVLGGYGLAGRAVVLGLLRAGWPVMAAGRNEKKLLDLQSSMGSSTPPLETCVVDVSKTSDASLIAMRQAMSQVQVVINCVGPFILHGSRLAGMALDAGSHYIDIASEQEHLRRLLKLDGQARRAGLSIVPGAGAYPGLSGLLLRRLLERYPKGAEGEIDLAMSSNPEGEGIAQLLSGALEMIFPLVEPEASGEREIFPGRLEYRDFPEPFGRLATLRWPQMELLTLSRSFSQTGFRSFIWPGHNPEISRFQVYLMRWLRPDRRPRAYRLLEKKARSMSQQSAGRTRHPEGSGTTGGMIRATLKDADHYHRLSMQFEDTERATAWLPVYLATELIRQQTDLSLPSMAPKKAGQRRWKSGVVSPAHLLDTDEIDHLMAELGTQDGVSLKSETLSRRAPE